MSNPEQQLLGDSDVMQLLRQCLTLKECEKLCKQRLGLTDVNVDKARQDTSNSDDAKFHMYNQWQQLTGKTMTANQLADHLAKLHLPRDRLEVALSLISQQAKIGMFG
jgi:hypothetical protein